MKIYTLQIAGYRIRVESSGGCRELKPSARFINWLSRGKGYDLLLRVHCGKPVMPADAVRVFHAPLIEERDGLPCRVADEFWSVYSTDSGSIYLTARYIRSAVPSSALLSFSLSSDVWDLWIEGGNFPADPLGYPVDSLLLYYLTVVHGDIMIHASGINYNGKGYIFSGVSGKGKSTMASLWSSAGAKVIHDDRLIIRKTGRGYTFHNTPVYDSDCPAASCLNAVFLLEHGRGNRLVRMKGARAAAHVLANCIQHNWNPEIIRQLVDGVSQLCETVPVYLLFFEPGNSVVDFLLSNE